MSFVFTDEFEYKDTPVSDAYRKLRVSKPFGIFNSSLQNNDGNSEWESVTSGTASFTYLPEPSVGNLTVGTANGNRMLRQTLQTFQYQTGTGTLVYMTGVLGAGQNNTRARLGIYDDFNGLFFEVRDGVFGVVLRKTLTVGNTVETFVPQSEFNGNPVDGTGPIPYNIDLNTSQIFSIDFAWLGVGRVRFGIWSGTCFCPVHTFALNNVSDGPYMGKGDLPLRYEVINTGTAPAAYTMKQICSAVFVEGGVNPSGFSRAAFTPPNNFIGLQSNNNWQNLISIRIKANLTRINLKIESFKVYSNRNDSNHLAIIKNATLPALTWNEASEFTEFATGGGTVTPGLLIFGDVIGGQRNSSSSVDATLIKDSVSTRYDGTSETFTLAARRIDGQNDLAATLNFIEFR